MEIRAWLLHEIGVLRQRDARTPLTISWTGAHPGDDLQLDRLLDAVSLSWTGSTADLTDTLEAYRAGTPDRPVLLSSVGIHAYNSWFPGGRTEAAEAAYVAGVLTVAGQDHVGGVFARAWRDPAAAAHPSKLPWANGPQIAIGLVRADGVPRPTAALFRPGADLASVPRPGVLDVLHKPFWQLVAALALGAALLLALRRRRHKRRHPLPTE